MTSVTPEQILDKWCESPIVTAAASALKSLIGRGDGDVVVGTGHRVWEMPAKQQAGEMLMLGILAIFVYGLMTFLEGPTRGGWKSFGLESMRMSGVPAQAKHRKTPLDWIWILVNVVTLCVYAWHRSNDGSLVYFTQVRMQVLLSVSHDKRLGAMCDSGEGQGGY